MFSTQNFLCWKVWKIWTEDFCLQIFQQTISTFLETFFGDDFQNKLSADIFCIHFLDKQLKRLWILLCRAPIAMFLYFVLSNWISYNVVTYGGKMNNQSSWLTNLYSVFDSEFRLLKSLKNLDRRFLSPDFSTFLETFFGDDFQNKLSADIFWIHFLDKEWKRLWILLCRAPIAMFLYFVLSKRIGYIVVT